MTLELRCGNCDHWLGESADALVYVEHVDHGTKSRVKPPRFSWRCNGCHRVNVFIRKSELLAALDNRRTA